MKKTVILTIVVVSICICLCTLAGYKSGFKAGVNQTKSKPMFYTSLIVAEFENGVRLEWIAEHSSIERQAAIKACFEKNGEIKSIERQHIVNNVIVSTEKNIVLPFLDNN